jgi:hypothetical protein
MDTITNAFVIQWDNAIKAQAQQSESRLTKCITDRGSITGESFTHNSMGTIDMPESATRLGDTEWGSIDHSTRVANMRDFYRALPLDRADIPKMLVNPVTGGDYMKAIMAARNRRVDNIIYNAMIGGQLMKDGSTTTLPSGQIILNQSAGLTKAKIITAKKIFRNNEADEQTGEELFMLYTGDALEDVLNDTQLTSADFMAVKMLQEGDMSSKWMGINWIPFQGVNTASSIAQLVMWARSGVKLGRGYEEGNVTRRGDKRDAWQVSMAASYGALRTEEAKVVRVDIAV